MKAGRPPGSPRQPRHDELHLWFVADPATPVLVGRLRLQATGGKGVSLHYAPSWLAAGFALSEDLPLVDIEFVPRRDAAAGAVDDACPDRWGERVIAYVDRPLRMSLMETLYYAGDDRFGALGVSTSATEYRPHGVGPLPDLGQVEWMSEVVAKIGRREAVDDRESAVIRAGGSFGGAKPKALVAVDGVPWMVKFFNGESVDQPLVEHATMTLAVRAGIRAARSVPLRLSAEHALLLERFDRAGATRLHVISAGTALRAVAADAARPELGYGALAEILRRSGDPATSGRDAAELFRRMVFNVLVDNTDDHEKNHALLAPAPNRLALSPAYDVVPALAGQGLHEFDLGDDGCVGTLENAMSQCTRFGLSRDAAAAGIVAVIAVVDQWQAHFTEVGVSAADVAALADQLDGPDLGAQRRGFRPPVPGPSKRSRKPGPFAVRTV